MREKVWERLFRKHKLIIFFQRSREESNSSFNAHSSKKKSQRCVAGSMILADGEVSYMKAQDRERRYYRARVRIGMYDPEPVAKAAVLMGVALMEPRKDRYDTCPKGHGPVTAKTLPSIVGRKSNEAFSILNDGGQVEQSIYKEFQANFPSLWRQGKLGWKHGAPGGNFRHRHLNSRA